MSSKSLFFANNSPPRFTVSQALSRARKNAVGRASAWRICAATLTLILLAACAMKPLAPTASLQAAEQAIASADRERAAENASAELSEARIKFNAANVAVRDENMVLAKYLADEARVSAELASARSDSVKAKAINADMQKSIDALKQEMQRASGDHHNENN